MTKSRHATASEVLARHWARKGPDELEMIRATLNLARQLLAGGEVQPDTEYRNAFAITPYPWEDTTPPSDAPRRAYLGTVSDLASGQGHTVYFAAGLARNEDEFRRQLAVHVGHSLANGAEVSLGLGDFQFSRTFITPSMRKTLKKFDEGKHAPASFFFLSRWHENRA